MTRVLPRSLIGQIALVMAVALLIAQAINFTLIVSGRQRLSSAQVEGPAIGRFVAFAQRLSAAPPDDRALLLLESPRRMRIALASRSIVPAGAGDPLLATRLREAAAEQGLRLEEVRAARSDLAPDRGRGGRLQALLLSTRLPDGSWINARLVTARRDPWLVARLAGATLLLYLFLLVPMLWFAARLARPLRDLTAAADRFRGRGEPPRVAPRGPQDIRRAIEAFNAMGARVLAMLDEKDRMLGAIGHDLRTPLASLRIRVEAMEPEEERRKMVATIEEVTAMLDDTLFLARSGRPREPARAVDVTALADAVAEEFAALGRPVEMAAGPRHVARVHPNLLRRAVRNLLDNAVAYAGAARLRVTEEGDSVVIEVSDNGPGIPPHLIEEVLEPFRRLEESRSRETGGSGLGLTIARAAALADGGALRLENRSEGGLNARIIVPKA